MAQLGSALDWGSRGRGFKSRQPDAYDVDRRPDLRAVGRALCVEVVCGDVLARGGRVRACLASVRGELREEVEQPVGADGLAHAVVEHAPRHEAHRLRPSRADEPEHPHRWRQDGGRDRRDPRGPPEHQNV